MPSDSLPKQCPECGREVPSFFDHIAVNCADWPDEPQGGEDVYYRGWEIGFDDFRANYVKDAWMAYKGGMDLDAPHISAETFFALCAEIDAEEGD